MATFSIFPQIDTTLYSHPDRSDLNTGHDEILEVVKEPKGNTYYPSRVVIKFKDRDIQLALQNLLKQTGSFVGADNWDATLKLYSTENKNLATDHILQCFPLSQSWSEGTGKYISSPQSSNGATWVYRSNNRDPLHNPTNKWITASFNTGVTGSFVKQKGGGNWYIGAGFKSSQNFLSTDDLDLSFNVTEVIKKYSSSYYQSAVYPTGLTNNGFIIKKSQPEEESLSSSFGELKYFSSQTHTIYSPRLEFSWDDSSYVTSSGATSLIGEEVFLSLYDNRGTTHKQNQAYKYPNRDFTPRRFRVTARKRYPDRAFVTSSNYLPIAYLPPYSQWMIKDGETDEVQQSGFLSADVKGHYFDVYVGGLYPERFYKFQFEIPEYDDGYFNYQTHTTILDEDFYFKLVR